MNMFKDVKGPPLIQALMKARKVTNIQIAETTKVTPVYVSYIINGHRKGYRIRAAIAKALGVSVGALWPDEEDPDYHKAA